MSSTHYVNLRTSPPQTRKTALKAARPAPSAASKVAFKGHGKSKQRTDKAKEKEEDIAAVDHNDDDDDMATSFPQFW